MVFCDGYPFFWCRVGDLFFALRGGASPPFPLPLPMCVLPSGWSRKYNKRGERKKPFLCLVSEKMESNLLRLYGRMEHLSFLSLPSLEQCCTNGLCTHLLTCGEAVRS